MIVLYIVLAVIVILAAIVMVRAATIKAPPRPEMLYKTDEEGERICAEKLSAMVKIPTVSKNEDEDLTEFFRLHEEMERLFPLLHANLEKTVLKGNLVYRWKGKDSSAAPILLMGHQDVVPASDQGWSVPAYSGVVKEDGCLYGRGAMDCKSTMLVELEAVERLLQEGFVPECDVYLEYSINEETSGGGAEMAVKWFEERGIRFAIVIDEGGAIMDRAVSGMDRPDAVIGITENGYMDLKISAIGKGGHSSTPPRHTPAARLFAFAAEVEKVRPFKKALIPETEAMFKEMAPSFDMGFRIILNNLWLFRGIFKKIMPMVSPFGEAILATSCCFTMMKGSDAANVIPKEPYLVANLRPSVHQNSKESLAVLQKYADKYGLKIEVLNARDASPVSNIHSKEYKYLCRCLSEHFPDCGVSPYVIMGGTDCRHFHALSENALRISPVRMTPEQSNSCHAVDENVSVAALNEGTEFFIKFIKGWKN
ncbi:MAG: M20/M25/M40 family metallo-hydrolase [Oscillospiraceae bacterium]|nr:M20/M25/M40 family metallo-hydrolase [Oscillospiraceae bacterium]